MKKLDAEWFLFWGGFFLYCEGGSYNEMRAQRGCEQQQQQQKTTKITLHYLHFWRY